MTYITESGKIIFADKTEIEVQSLKEEKQEETLILEFEAADFSEVKKSFYDPEKTKEITTPNGEYHNFTKVKNIIVKSSDESRDLVTVELQVDKYEAELTELKNLIEELQNGLLELVEMVYNKPEEEEEKEEEKE